MWYVMGWDVGLEIDVVMINAQKNTLRISLSRFKIEYPSSYLHNLKYS